MRSSASLLSVTSRAAAAILKLRRFFAAGEPRHLRLGSLAVVDVYQVDDRARHELLERVTEHALPGRIEPREIALEICDAQQIAGDGEKSIALVLGSLALGDIVNRGAAGDVIPVFIVD